MNEDMIAPCGMNCALCGAYQFYQGDLNRFGFRRKYCPGCIPRNQNCLHMKDSCPILGVGKVRFCFECEDFPCRRLKALDKRYRLKYNMSMIENLKMIQSQGMAAFLHEQQRRWQCPDCGNLRCCHNGLCLNCDFDRLAIGRKTPLKHD